MQRDFRKHRARQGFQLQSSHLTHCSSNNCCITATSTSRSARCWICHFGLPPCSRSSASTTTRTMSLFHQHLLQQPPPVQMQTALTARPRQGERHHREGHSSPRISCSASGPCNHIWRRLQIAETMRFLPCVTSKTQGNIGAGSGAQQGEIRLHVAVLPDDACQLIGSV
jgi:hypothetical protein